MLLAAFAFLFAKGESKSPRGKKWWQKLTVWQWVIGGLGVWWFYSKYIAPFLGNMADPMDPIINAQAPTGYSLEKAKKHMNEIVRLLAIGDDEGFDYLTNDDEQGSLDILRNQPGSHNRYLASVWQIKRNEDMIEEMSDQLDTEERKELLKLMEKNP